MLMSKECLLLALVMPLAVPGYGGALLDEDSRTNFGPMTYAEVRGYNVKPTIGNKSIPEELRITQEEADRINEWALAEERKLGYAPKKGPAYAGHWFGHWTKRYWDTHREYFGLCPNGERGVVVPGFPPWMKGLSKLCVSNDETVRLRIESWVRAGKPECLKLGETDGLWGFCRCDGCRALDADRPGAPFLETKTDRYVNFWNRVTERARRLRPDVKVTVHVYNRFYEPPRREKIAFPDNMMFSFVTKYEDADPVSTVRAWKKAGMKHFFHRPNYLCNRSVFPIGREKFVWRIHRQMLAEGSLGDYYDVTRGVPSTSFDIYVAQRLCVDPNASFVEIERDWCSRYGKAAEVVKRYHARIRERCDRGFAAMLDRHRREGIEYLDDSHFSRSYHMLHRVDELEGDLALLKGFDESGLDGDAKERFESLKTNARHYIVTKRAHETESDADKKALLEFRIANKARLGTAWAAYRNKGEFWLWKKDPMKAQYEESGSVRFVERYENERAVDIPEIRVFKDYGPPSCVSSMVPAELRFGKDEGALIHAREQAWWKSLGYKEKMPYHSGHSFTRWAKKHWDTHREYFGLLPNGQRGLTYPGLPSWLPKLSKVCVSSEAVINEKLAEWERAKCPELLVAGENDGDMGYCRCEKCMKMDAPVEGEGFVVNKSDRYMAFWNRLAAKAIKKRPDVKVCVFLYSATRRPPRRTHVAYPGNMIFSYVPTLHDDDPSADILGWKKKGAMFFYSRPNYLCIRSALPAGLERYICDVHNLMEAHGSKGDYYDRGGGYNAQQFTEFAALMLCADPKITFAEIEAKWCARFGAAAETVKRYHAGVRERCEREWPKLRRFLRDNGIEFLDDSHFSRCLHKLHTVADLEEDKAVLDAFDVSLLDGEAKERFLSLKAVAEQAVLVMRMFKEPSQENKDAVFAFRKLHKNALGHGWMRIYTKGEFWVWNETPGKIFYENSAIKAYAERLEDSLAPGRTPLGPDDPEAMRIHECLKSCAPLR